MSTNLEVEFKNMLTEEEYLNLLSSFNIEEEQMWTQKNIYFDTFDHDIKAHEAALRIRVKGNSFELTLKTKAKIGLIETNQKITKEAYNALMNQHVFPEGEVEVALLKLGIDLSRLRVTTDLTTKRAEASYKNGLLVFDKSFYHGIIDFELEYEVTDYESGLVIFNNFLSEHQIPTRLADNKIKRALAAVSNN